MDDEFRIALADFAATKTLGRLTEYGKELIALRQTNDILIRKVDGLENTIGRLSSACHRLAHLNPSAEANEILKGVHLSQVEVPQSDAAGAKP